MRLKPLDSLRGIAAFVILLQNAVLLIPGFAHAYKAEWSPDASVETRIIAHSPVHLLWAGQEAIILFFVLSGLSLLRQAESGWSVGGFLLNRFFRIYLPYAFSLGLGAGIILLLRHIPHGSIEAPWLNLGYIRYFECGSSAGFDESAAACRFARRQYHQPGHYADHLFAETFAALSRADLVFRTCAQFLFGGNAACLDFGTCGNQTAYRLDEHGVIAAQHDNLSVFPHAWRLDYIPLERSPVFSGKSRELALLGLISVATVLLDARWEIAPKLGLWPTGVGAAIITLLALEWPAFRNGLTGPVLSFLGKISFSLYLTHLLVFTALGRILAITEPPLAVILACCAAAIPVAAIFYFIIEKPAHLLSRALGRRQDNVPGVGETEERGSRAAAQHLVNPPSMVVGETTR